MLDLNPNGNLAENGRTLHPKHPPAFGIVRSVPAGRAAIASTAAIVVVVAAAIPAAKAIRIGAATPAAPQIVGRDLGTAWDRLVGQCGSGQGRDRESSEECSAQKYSHLGSP
jgi:hypothetical protein